MKLQTLFTLFLSGITAYSVSAQTIVTTTPSNKNVVLEELTGIHCGYCPDGHLKAQQLSDDNSGRVVVVNIHTGSYASPSAGEPDFRTTWGDYVQGLFPVSGYPTGSVNRRPFPGTVMNSRSAWAGNAFTVLAEASPVNVGATANLDMGGRVATVNVEAYYTANGTGSTNSLHAILLQDNVPGPQSGGATWNPNQILPNGDYNHMHMFRHNFSPNGGDPINTITSGSLYTDFYSYTMPNDYLGVALNIQDLHVAVFVTEATSTGAVVTGDYASLTFVTPTTALDMSTSSGVFGSTTDYCANGTAFTPSFSVENATNNSITSIEASYTINAGTAVTTTLSGLSLANGNSTTVTFPTVAMPAGVNFLEYNIVQLNGTDPDYISSNNLEMNGTVIALSGVPTLDSLQEDFENPDLSSGADTLVYSQVLPGALFVNPYSISYDVFGVVGYKGSTFDLTQTIHANLGSTEFPNQAYGEVIFDNVNLSGRANATLTFDYAHAEQTQNWGDGFLEVFGSQDCGATWDTLWRRIDSDLATASAVWYPNYFYPGSSADWEAATVDLSAYDNAGRLAIKMKMGKISSANSLYIDNINITSILPTQKIENLSSLSVKPNPVHHSMTIDFSLKESQGLNISILNALGQQVKHISSGSFIGTNSLSVNVSDFTAGVYFLNFTSADGVRTERFVVSK